MSVWFATQRSYRVLIASPSITTSIIGGDGSGQHPSQSFKLWFDESFMRNLATFEGLKAAIAGDQSLTVAKSNMQNWNVCVKLFLQVPGMEKSRVCGLWTVCNYWWDYWSGGCLMLPEFNMNAMIVEPFFSKEDYHAQYLLETKNLRLLKETAPYPAPVNRRYGNCWPLAEQIQNRIVQQMTNGVFVRMAILELY